MEGLSFRNLYSVAAMVVRVSACLLTEWRLKLLSKLRTLRTVSSQSLISSMETESSV